MDGSFEIDLDALRDSLLTADHLLLRFIRVPERFLLDFRTNEASGPGVALLPQVNSFTERLATIERARPGFPKPERLFVVNWPLRVASLERLGVLGTVRERLATLDAFDALRELDETYQKLVALEEQEILNAVRGEGYHALWPTERTTRSP